MNKSMRWLALVAVMAGSIGMAGCSSKITDEQLAQLKDLRQQEATLQSQVRQRNDAKSQLTNEVSRLQADLNQCGQDKSFVQGKLAQWPNVWPDWQYTPEAAPSGSNQRDVNLNRNN